MRISRVFTASPLAPGAHIELDARAARYVAQVLRLRRGQYLTLFNGDGSDWSAELTRCDRQGCAARIAERLTTEPAARHTLHLGIGVSRGERMDCAIQKSVELGVTAITPLLTERSVVRLDATRVQKRLGHWRGIVTAACEQSGRSRLPALHPITPLSQWLDGHDSGLLLYHQATASLTALPPPTGGINLLVGPEGGLNEHERTHAVTQGFTPVRLGPRVLRTETAPLAALAVIQALWGDFRA